MTCELNEETEKLMDIIRQYYKEHGTFDDAPPEIVQLIEKLREEIYSF